MVVDIERNQILALVNAAVKAVSTHSVLPIMQCVYIEAQSDGTVVMEGNSLDIGIRTKDRAMVLEPGACCIEARTFSKIIKSLPDDLVHLEADKELKVSCKKAKFSLPIQDATTFSRIPEMKGAKVVAVDTDEFINALRGVIFSAAVDERSKMMTGVHMSSENGKLTLTALDGHRIARWRLDEDASDADCTVQLTARSSTPTSTVHATYL